MSFDALLDAEFRTDPWSHQLREFELSADLPGRALLWQMRTGKSKEVVDQACSLYVRGRIDAVIIFAPNGVHENWVEREFPTHAWFKVAYRAFAWRTRVAGLRGGNRLGVKAKAAWEEVHRAWHDGLKQATGRHELLVASFNSESITREDVRKAVKRIMHKRRALVVWDESSDYRTPDSARSKMARSIALVAPFRRILDGTVITNSPLAAFAQFELVEKEALGFRVFNTARDRKTGLVIPGFKDRYAVFEEAHGRGRSYPRLVGFQNLEELRTRMAAHSSVVLRSDCEDLPGLVRRPVKVALSPEQSRIYAEVEKQIRIEIAAGEVATIGAKTVKLQKLQQVLGGFLIDEHGKVHSIPGTLPRMEAMSDEVFYASGPVIVYAQFHHELDAVAVRLRADGHEVWEYHGRVKAEEKQRIRKEFPELEGRKVVLVAQCQSAGRGLLLPAGLILWYSHTFSGIFREQGNERATVMGGENVQLVDLIAPGVDRYILNTVEQRIEIADHVAGRGLQEILNANPLTEAEDDY